VSEAEVTCREFVELLTDYVEGVLDERTLSRVENHLALCDGCVTYSDQMRATVEALATLPPEPVPKELRRALAAALAAK